MIVTEMTFYLSTIGVGLSVGMLAEVFLDRWDDLLHKRIAHLEETMQALGFDTRHISHYLRLWSVSMVIVPLLVLIGMDLGVVVFPVAFILWKLPLWIMNYLIDKRKKLFRDQMIPLCVSLANSARSGLSLPKGLEDVLPELQFPLKNEVSRIVNDYRHGRSIIEAIRDAQKRLQLDHFNVFTSVILTCFETGSNYCVALDKMSHALMENQRLERKMDSETAAGRSVIQILSAFPSVFVVLFYYLAPDMVKLLLWEPKGQIAIVVAAFLNYCSVKMALKYMSVRI